jgi:hypothetical protein
MTPYVIATPFPNCFQFSLFLHIAAAAALSLVQSFTQTSPPSFSSLCVSVSRFFCVRACVCVSLSLSHTNDAEQRKSAVRRIWVQFFAGSRSRAVGRRLPEPAVDGRSGNGRRVSSLQERLLAMPNVLQNVLVSTGERAPRPRTLPGPPFLLTSLLLHSLSKTPTRHCQK